MKTNDPTLRNPPSESLITRQQTTFLGIAGPLSGRAALLGTEMKQAVELAIEDTTSNGISAQIIRSQSVDDGGTISQGEAVARNLCAQPNLLGVVGHYNSDVTIAASTLYHEVGLAMITPIASNPKLTERGLNGIFRLTNRDDCTAMAIAGYLYRTLGKRRAVVIESATAYGKSMAEHFATSFSALGGNITTRLSVEEGQRGFESLITALPRQFDLVFYGGTFEGAPILCTMRSIGINQLFATGDGCWDVNHFLKPAGEAATAGEGVLVLSASPEIGRVPGSEEFAKRYSLRYGPIGNYAVNSYDAARLLLQAMEQAATSTGRLPQRADVIDALSNIKFQGIAYPHPHQWDENGDNLAALTVLHTVQNGQFRQIAEITRDNTGSTK
jgi:branched-chain amino acid transport system substrate-binding protein